MKPNLETLEGRLVPATLTWNFNSENKDGVLQIDLPKDSGNVLAVSGAGVKIKVENYKNDSVKDMTVPYVPSPYNKSLNVPDSNINSYFVDGNKVNALPDVNWVVNIQVNGSNKNDYIDIGAFAGQRSNVFGLGGNDYIIGSNSANCLDGISGGDGNDCLLGGDGKDSLVGGNGNDQLNGGKGFDDLYGGLGSDILSDPDLAFWSAGGGGLDTIRINGITYVVNDNYTPNDNNSAERIGTIAVINDKTGDKTTYTGKFFNGNQNERINVLHTWIEKFGKNKGRSYGIRSTILLKAVPVSIC